jgi:hypothetical protein
MEMEQVNVTNIDTTTPSSNPDAEAMALTGNTAVDLANVARELGIKLDANGNIAEAQPAQTSVATPAPQRAPAVVQPQAAKVETPAETNVQVPAKFLNEDGTPNVEKIEKSTKSVEEMIAYYKAKEREAQQTQNRVNNPAPAQQAQQYQQAPQAQQGFQLSEFERQAAIDILNDARALGIQMSEQQAILQARADIRMSEAKYAAEQNSIGELRRELGEQRMTAELKDLMAADPDLLTPAVADRVLAIRAENPAMRSYREAYIQHLGEQAIAQRTGQVKTPTPTGQTAKAPATPVGPVTRVQRTVDISNPSALSDAQLEAEARKMFPGIRLR